MIDPTKPQPFSYFQQPIVTASLTIQAYTNTERIVISGVCLSISQVVAAISQIEETDNSIIRCVAEADRHHRALLLELKWKNLSTLTLIRQALAGIDVRIEQVNIDYTPPASNRGCENYLLPPDRFSSRPITPPAVCQGCHYYYGRFDRGNFLVCAVHPYGPEDSHCQEWVSSTLGHPHDLSIKKNR